MQACPAAPHYMDACTLTLHSLGLIPLLSVSFADVWRFGIIQGLSNCSEGAQDEDKNWLCRKLPAESVSAGWGPLTCSWRNSHPRSLSALSYRVTLCVLKIGLYLWWRYWRNWLELVSWWFCLRALFVSPRKVTHDKNYKFLWRKIFLYRCSCMFIKWHPHTVTLLDSIQSTIEDVWKLSPGIPPNTCNSSMWVTEAGGLPRGQVKTGPHSFRPI